MFCILLKLPAILMISLATVAAAQASFDLVFVLDVTARKIHRLDGDSGVYLGAFDVNSNSVSMAVDSGTGRVYVAEGGLGFAVYNGYTGALVGANWNPIPYNASYGFSNNLLYGQNNVIYSCADPSVNPFAPFTVFANVANGTAGGTSMTALSRVGDTLHALDNNNKRIVRLNLNTPSSQSFVAMSPGITYSNRLAVDGDMAYSLSSAGVIYHTNLTSGVSGTTILSLTNPGVGFASVKGIAAGHLGTQYLVGTTATGNQIMRTNRNAAGVLFSRREYNVPGLASTNDVAVLVAPEPGTMVALAGGVAVLLRRRRIKRA